MCICDKVCIIRTKKMSVPAFKYSAIVGRNSSKLALIRNASGAQIEVEKGKRQAPLRVFIIKLVDQ